MGLDISIELLTLIMFGSLLVLLMAGLPLAFVTGGLACVFLFLMGDARALNIVPSRIFPLMTNYQLSAIPLFIFMAAMLERAGIINDMFDVIYKVLGGVKGGLASATIIASTILAAMVGVIGAAVVTMGIIALPAMLKRGYDPKIAMGSIMAGGTLGILIPPSILAIIYAVVAEQSVGVLFLAAMVPGIILALAMALLIVGMAHFWPSFVGTPTDALADDDRGAGRAALKLFPIVLLIGLVLGGIYGGLFTPVEAGAVGALGALLIALALGRLTLSRLWRVLVETGHISVAILFLILAGLFRSVRDAGLVLVTIPLATVGGVAVLRILDMVMQSTTQTRQPLDLLTMMGFIILLGLVINNAILLVDQTRQGEREGLGRTEDFTLAAIDRGRPGDIVEARITGNDGERLIAAAKTFAAA